MEDRPREDDRLGGEHLGLPDQRERAHTQAFQSLPEASTPPSPLLSDERKRLGRLSGVHRALRTRITIGRANDSDVVVDDLLVSRRHAEMTLRPDGSWELSDLGSNNGTFVNGRRIESRVLDQLDVVTVGHHSFRLVESELEEYVDEGQISFEAIGLTTRAENGKVLLSNVSFKLEERSFVAVVGPSGAGKSTLLNALTGFRPADEGHVLYGGRDLYEQYDELRTRIGFVPQEDIVHGSLTVRQALGYAAELRFSDDVSPADRSRRVVEVMAELGLDGVADTQVASLSGGQRRRVSVGLELITKPSLLILDEPTSGLDPGYERELMTLLRELADGGRTVVVVTHSMESLRLCDRVLFLAPGGRTAYFGPAQLAPAFFARDDLQEVFQDLSAHSDVDWAARFRQHPYYTRYVEVPGAEAPAPVPAERRRLPKIQSPQSWFAQFAMLVRRYSRVVVADRRNLALLALQPLVMGLLILVALPAKELGAPPEGELRIVSRAGLVLLVLVLAATWLGASNAIREICKELPILRRERAVGLSASAYVWSKAAVLGVLTTAQMAVLVPLALARQSVPSEGALLGFGMGELFLVATLAGIAGMALGLLISAVAASVDRAMAVLPVVLIIQMLLAMGGVFPDLVDKPVLKQASYGISAQWAFSASASTVDLDRLQSVDRVARDLPTVRIEDPLPVLRSLSEPAESERRWRHDWPTWLWNAAALLALSSAGVLGAIAAVWRRRPEV